MKYTSLCLFFLLSLTDATRAQEWLKDVHQHQLNFYQIQKKFYKQLKEEAKKATTTASKSEKEESDHELFKRWEYYYGPRVYPSGDLSLVSSNYHRFQEYLKQQNTNHSNKLHQLGLWTPVGPMGDQVGGNVGRLNFIRVKPGSATDFWVGSPAGGIWNSTNAGADWTIKNESLNITGCSDLAIDPSNTTIMYMATGDGDGGDTYSIGVYKSTDGGTSWNATGLSYQATDMVKIYRLLINPNNPQLLLAATSNGIFQTTNAALNWTKVSVNTVRDMEYKPNDPNTVYASGNSFYKSTNGGASWSPVTSGTPSSAARICIGVSAADPEYVYLLAANNTTFKGIYRSTNSGTSFTTRTTSPNMLGYSLTGNDSHGQAWYDLCIAVSPSNKDELVIGGVQIWKSTNGGTSFTCKTSWYGENGVAYCHADIHDLHYLNPNTIMAATDGGLFISTDGANTWEARNGKMNISQLYDIGVAKLNPNIILGGLQDNSSIMYNGNYWLRNNATGDGFVGFVDYSNINTMYSSSYYANFFRSENGGASWINTTSGLPSGNWKTDWQQDPQTPTTLYAGIREVYKSVNSGDNWSQLTAIGAIDEVVKFEVAPSNNQVIYVCYPGAIYKSTNGGNSWSVISNSLPVLANFSWIKVHPADANTAWVSYSGYTAGDKIVETKDGGSTWTNISNGLPNLPATCITYATGTNEGIYLGMDIGVYFKAKNQNTWSSFFNGLPNVSISDLEFHQASGKLRASTYGRGVWETDLEQSGALQPFVLFNSSKKVICAGNSVQFTDQSLNAPTSWKWTFNGGTPASSAAQHPSVTYPTPGKYEVKLRASNNNGSDSLVKLMYMEVTGVHNPPITEDFNSTAFPPPNWNLDDINQDGACWEYCNTTGSQGSSSCMRFDNFNIYPANAKDGIFMPRLNFNGMINPTLSFDLAYKYINANYSDSLIILLTEDCGLTYKKIFEKGGADLATVPGINDYNPFSPANNQWRNEKISLSAYAGKTDVGILFQNRGYNGQLLYIDKINLSDNNLVETTPGLLQLITLAPNPNNGSFTLKLHNGPAKDSYQIRVFNALGKLLAEDTREGQDFKKEFQLEEKGLYFIHVQSLHDSCTLKVLVQ